MRKTSNVYLIGPMGAGKSTIGRHLAKDLQLDFYDTDQEIESRSGADIGWIFDVEGEKGFRKREKNVIKQLTELQGIVLATGGGAVLAAENRNRLAARGTVIYLTASVEQQLQRTEKDKKRPLLQGVDNTQEALEKMATLRDPLYREIADFVVETDGRTVKIVAKEIMQLLQESLI